MRYLRRQLYRWLLGTSVLAVACAPHTPPPQPPPTAHTEAFTVQDSSGHVLLQATATLTLDDGTPVLTSFLLGEQLAFTIPPTAVAGWGAWLHVDAPQAVEADIRVYIHATNGGLLEGCGCPPVVTLRLAMLSALHARGQFFEQVDGTRITMIEASSFNLLNIYQNLGPAAAEPVAQQLHAEGFNLARVWTAYTAGTGAGSFLNIDYTKVGPFLDFMAANSLYVDLTAYAGRDSFIAGRWDSLCRASQGHTNVLLSLVNENDQTNNTIDLRSFHPCPGILSSRGSNGSQAWPPDPTGWAWSEMHYNDAPEWWRKTGHNSMEVADQFRLPIITNENTRFDKMGDFAAALMHLQDAAQGCVLLNAGCAFHSIEGKQALIMAGNVLAAARAHVTGMKSLPLLCQDGGYAHRIDLEGPGQSLFLRVYQRGSNPICLAKIRH